MNSGDPVPEAWRSQVSEVMIGSADIATRLNDLAADISADYMALNPVLVVVLKGSFIFASDLSRALTIPHEVEFMRAKSYQGVSTTGVVQIEGIDLTKLIDRHVIIIEDIIDTGLTLNRIYAKVQSAGVASVKTCVLLEKMGQQRRRDVPFFDYVAFHVPEKFVVGYGLDMDQTLRHLPFIGVYKN